MSKITQSLSAKTDPHTGKVEIYLRFRAGRKAAFRVKSGIFISTKQWNEKKGELKTSTFGKEEVELKQKLDNLCNTISTIFTQTPIEEITKDWLQEIIYKFHHPVKEKKQDSPQIKEQTFFELITKYIEQSKHCHGRKQHYWVLFRSLQRFELFKQHTEKKSYKLNIQTINEETLRSFEDFLTNEHLYYKKYKKIYEKVPETRKPQARGQNTINGFFKKLRAIVLWSIKQEITTNDPFRKFKIEESIYGTPYYLTIEERNTIYKSQFPNNPQQEIQKDIFILQCLIGCRVGDLLKLTKGNIIDGAIEYIPRKTQDERATTVTVPLSETAQEIINRYADEESNKLLPFISEQKYNIYIKNILTEVGITRMVTVINPTTREEEKKAINEIASSHIARRTFIGNLYKKVKDPNLVGALSGHKEGSKAFARYREIDKDMRTELIKLLE